MSLIDWNKKIEYLKTTRKQMWNDDYFEFLVKCVWKFDRPVDVIDFGCGYGFLGMKLLPLLPKGSTYTGIDIAEELLKDAEHIFSDTEFNTTFILSDLLSFSIEKKYDVAICQSVLRHIPQYKEVLDKMLEVVLEDGMVICIEPNRRMENAGVYVDDPDFGVNENDDLLQIHWENELHEGGRDYLVGIKIPIYMEQIGLKDVQVRVNDFVEFVSLKRDGKQYEAHKLAFCEHHLNGNQGENANSFLSANCHLISYGKKCSINRTCNI